YCRAADPIEQARRAVVRSFFGHGGSMARRTVKGGLMRSGFRQYSIKNQWSSPAQDWKNYAEALPALIERLRGVVLEHRPALFVLRKHDSERTLHYVDPPYLQRTKRDYSRESYRFSMGEKDHA